MTVYYLGRGDNASNITPFPPGFRMVSGDALARSYDTTVLTYKNARPVADRVSFACLDSSSQPETPGLKDTSCSNGLRAQIHFQSCWNGVDLYKTDNSHVAYMSTMDNGVCPPTHPVQLIHLFFEVLYGVNNIKLDNGGRFVFAQGDPTGYGFHGDFLNGWDVGVQQAAITQCGFPGNPSGAIVSCPPLAAVDKQDTSSICPIRPALINEPATGMISKLPGCITITPGPQKATEADMVCASGVSQPSLSARSHAHRLSLRSAAHHHRHHDTTNDNSTINNSTTSDNSTRCITPPIPVVSGMAWAGCFAEGTTGLALTGATYTNPEGMTLDTCVQYCSGKGFGWAGAEDGDLYAYIILVIWTSLIAFVGAIVARVSPTARSCSKLRRPVVSLVRGMRLSCVGD